MGRTHPKYIAPVEIVNNRLSRESLWIGWSLPSRSMMVINDVVTILSFFVLKALNAVKKKTIASSMRSVIQAFASAVDATCEIFN